ncbi:ATP-binding protein [Jannaschia rubra]|uniref:ATP-binding protein n=1 Tax=Jannaschia rubra TaxID=282197 RepID=UPI002490EA2A|nr:ATP-binding protein [Jannaschia rubra]
MSALRRFRPDSLGARFALLLVVALVTANLIALALLSFDRARQDRAALVEREAERIVSLVPAIEAVAPAVRRAIARNASTRFSRVSVDAEPLVGDTPRAPRSTALMRQLIEALGDRPLRAAVRARPDREGQGGPAMIAVSIALSVPEGEAAQWLNVVSRGYRRRPEGPDQEIFLIVLGLSLALVLGAALLYVRRLTRPLRELADAARAAGRGDRTARVAEAGPREMRDAAAAFNDMQGRIARFDAERMRTLAAVGHDLRTPITSLRIRTELLEEADAAPMIRTLDEMTVMADGLVAYARGARDAETTRDIDLADLLRRLCGERGAEFDGTEAVAVTGRPVALRRAFGNLVDNAVRYGGSARVHLSRDGPDAVVTVEDDGPGIPPERLAAVLEPFVRGDDSRSAQTGGAGLGLSIAQTIVAAHGGAITLENGAEGGLRATVRLPRTKGARSSQAGT